MNVCLTRNALVCPYTIYLLYRLRPLRHGKRLPNPMVICEMKHEAMAEGQVQQECLASPWCCLLRPGLLVLPFKNEAARGKISLPAPCKWKMETPT